MTNNQSQKTDTSIRHYFIDEGGDGTLFSKKGKVLIDTEEGCSRLFYAWVAGGARLQRHWRIL